MSLFKTYVIPNN